MLAAELTLAGVDVAVLERRASRPLAGSRAGGLHARTIEILDMRGIAAWVGEQSQRGLADALSTWFGPPAA